MYDSGARRVYDAGMREYERQLGLKEHDIWYDLQEIDQLPAEAFIQSKRAGTAVYLTGRSVEKRAHGSLLTVVFVVTELREVRCPDEEKTTAQRLCYYRNPDLVGVGTICAPRTVGPRISTFRFALERLWDDQPSQITGGTMAFDRRQWGC